jgi:hypothetical protein
MPDKVKKTCFFFFFESTFYIATVNNTCALMKVIMKGEVRDEQETKPRKARSPG